MNGRCPTRFDLGYIWPPGPRHRRTAINRLIVLLVCVAVTACAAPVDRVNDAAPAPIAGPPEWPHGAMVSAANPAAVDAALGVLRNGGHAVDAAIAAHAVLGLVEPESSGLGGSGFMLVYDRASDRLSVYDGRETAPAGITAEAFLKDGQPMGFLDLWPAGATVGVPGVVALYERAHADYGRAAWADLFEPAIDLAGRGFEVTPKMARYLGRMASMVDMTRFPAMSAYLFPGGQPLEAGAVLTNPDYAQTLERIADDGAKAFYTGDIAAAIAARARTEPVAGTLAVEDIERYSAVRRDAVCGAFRSYTICSTPPPSSGLAHIMMAALYDRLLPAGASRIEDRVAAFVDAQRLAYADRDHYVGDPAFASVPVDALIDPRYLDVRAGQRFGPADKPVHGDPGAVAGREAAFRFDADATVDAMGTTHLSIIDAQGNAVAMTASVGFPYGSMRMVHGFFLNNELTDFSRDPDAQAAANAIAPGKRPRSSMSPTIVFDAQGELSMLTGSAGGSSILAYTTKTILGALDWGLSAQEATDFPNVVARGEKVGVEISAAGGQPLADDLAARGYEVQQGRGENSGLHVIVLRLEGLDGAADSRRHGTVGALPR